MRIFYSFETESPFFAYYITGHLSHILAPTWPGPSRCHRRRPRSCLSHSWQVFFSSLLWTVFAIIILCKDLYIKQQYIFEMCDFIIFYPNTICEIIPKHFFLTTGEDEWGDLSWQGRHQGGNLVTESDRLGKCQGIETTGWGQGRWRIFFSRLFADLSGFFFPKVC